MTDRELDALLRYALLDAGAVNGGTPAEVCGTDLNLRKETLKAAVVGLSLIHILFRSRETMIHGLTFCDLR